MHFWFAFIPIYVEYLFWVFFQWKQTSWKPLHIVSGHFAFVKLKNSIASISILLLTKYFSLHILFFRFTTGNSFIQFTCGFNCWVTTNHQFLSPWYTHWYNLLMGLLDSTTRPSTILYVSTWQVYWFNYQMRLGNLFPLCHIIWIFWMDKISLKKARKWAWNRWILAASWGCQSHKWMRMASKIQPLNTFMGMYLLTCMP